MAPVLMVSFLPGIGLEIGLARVRAASVGGTSGLSYVIPVC